MLPSVFHQKSLGKATQKLKDETAEHGLKLIRQELAEMSPPNLQRQLVRPPRIGQSLPQLIVPNPVLENEKRETEEKLAVEKRIEELKAPQLTDNQIVALIDQILKQKSHRIDTTLNKQF